MNGIACIQPFWLIREDLDQEQSIIPLERLKLVLSELEIPCEVVSNDCWEERSGSKIDLKRPSCGVAVEETLWSDSTTRIDIISSRYFGHLLIRLQNPTSFHEVSDDQILAINRTRTRLSLVFQKIFGSPDYSEAFMHLDQDQNWTLEIFPVEMKRGDQVDYYSKVQRTIYVITQGEFVDFGFPLDRIDELRRELSQTVIESTCSIDRDQRTAAWRNKILYYRQAGNLTANALLHIWSEQGKPVIPLPPLEKSPAIVLEEDVRERDRCSFCRPEVIERQKILEEETLWVLYNIWPYVGGKKENSQHLLVVSKHHLENPCAATEEELLEEHRVMGKLCRAARGVFPNMTQSIFRQQGFQAGQTEPHNHWHIVMMEGKEDITTWLARFANEFLRVFPPSVHQPSSDLARAYHLI